MKTESEWIDVYNDFYKGMVADPFYVTGNQINKEIEKWLFDILIKAKEPYYNSGNIIMDDITFDRFENHLRFLNENHEYFNLVGTKQ